MKNAIVLSVFILLVLKSFAQTTTLETNPSTLRWYQVNTKHFKVVYPKGFDEQAQRVANTLEHIHIPESRTLGSSPRKISVILQNQSSVSNGFVSMTPRRSEFYAMPSQNYNFQGTNDWLTMLASHEYRHIVQNQHAMRGLNRVFYYLFGANTFSATSHLAVPSWFWEGDAVAAETAFTHSGRGRILNFGLLFKSNLLEGRTFNYDKQYLRSYKHNIPDHYVLGYHMIGYLRRRTNDPEIWGKITAHAWNIPIMPFTFSIAVKRESGMYVSKLYKTMAADLKKEWQAEIDKLELTPFTTLNTRRTKRYIDYQFPQPFDDGKVLVMKSGIGDIDQLCVLNDGEEEKGFTPGFVNESGMLSVAGSKVVWNEYGYDPRWAVRNYSLIKTYDFKSKKKKVIGSRRSRYAGAAFSPDGNYIVTVRTDNSYKTSLVVLDYNTGKEFKTFPNPSNDFFSMPRWSEDGLKIVVLRREAKGKAVSLIDFNTGEMRDLLPVSQENIGYPVLKGNYLLYNSPRSGIDNIYALNLQNTTSYQITTSKYGAYNPAVSIDGSTLYYNEQTKDGFDVVQVPFDPRTWSASSAKSNETKTTADILSEQEGMPNLFDSIPSITLPVKKYSKFKGIINAHSWGAFVTNNFVQPTVGIMSRDVLSTTLINAGYQYDILERTGLWKAGVSYQGFFPIIDVEATTGKRQVSQRIFSRDVKFMWQETGVIGGLRVPLVLTRSKYYSRLDIGNSIGYSQISSFRNEVKRNGVLISAGSERYVPANDTLLFVFNDRVGNGNLLYNRASVSYYRFLKQSRRDFNPRFGQSIDVEHYSTPYGGDYKAGLTMIQGALYFPGLFKHHSFNVRGGLQHQLSNTDLDIYMFRNRLFRPRGHSYPKDSKFYSVAVNYALPVWYPDIHIGPLLNIQRIKANLFYDYGQGNGQSYFYDVRQPNDVKVYYSVNDGTYKSVGVEMTFDVNLIRILPQFELGLRTTYTMANEYSDGGPVFEFLIGNIPF